MEIFDNISKTVRDDLAVTIERGSRLSIAAACFSIYAYQVLRKQFDHIEELHFIFTSPAFVTEKVPKEKREFYIPRLNRKRSDKHTALICLQVLKAAINQIEAFHKNK